MDEVPQACQGDFEEVRVFDSFLSDPDAWRAEALAARYRRPHPRFPWYVSIDACSELDHTVQRISNLIGLPLRDWRADGDGSTLGRFHIFFGGAEPLAKFHADPFDMGAVLYLSPEPPVGSGTLLSRTLTRIRQQQGEPLMPILAGDAESVDTANTIEIANQYNRLVIYRGARYHRASGYFGRSRKSGRLTVTFFFNTSAPGSPAPTIRRARSGR